MKKMTGSYNANKVSAFYRAAANADKASAHGNGNKIHTPFGIIQMYKSNGKRFYSISGSTEVHNGGNYRIGSIFRIAKMLEEKYA